MEEIRIKQEETSSIHSVNNEKMVDVELANKSRFFPYDSVKGSLDLYKLYQTERDNSDKYRFIFSVNTIASNDLFNMKTEVVLGEGNYGSANILDDKNDEDSTDIPDRATSIAPLNRRQAIRDTEYSHKDILGYVYHCGTDIFNNHMLRSKGFVHIQKYQTGIYDSENSGLTEYFNTIRDVRRRNDGSFDYENNPVEIDDSKKILFHVYQRDTINDIYDAYDEKLSEKDGWVGFYNPTNIAIPNGKNGLIINKLLNNNIGGEFIDMYPDRSLFSFIPKYNKYKKRNEQNWDYCLTYPYKSDKKTFNIFNLKAIITDKGLYAEFVDDNGERNDEILNTNYGIGIVNIERVKSNSGAEMFQFTTLIKHNLKQNDNLVIRKFERDDQDGLYPENIKTKRVYVAALGKADGTDKEHIFNVWATSFDGFGDINDIYSFAKISNGAECEYYIRKFKKIKNEDGKELSSTLSKLGFGESIYGDRTAQIVYTDTVTIGNLKDNMGRPVSDVYLTITKNNSGWKDWYEDNKYGGSAMTFSHCFGKVTSGFDVGNVKSDYNLRKLHNVNSSAVKDEDYIEGLLYVFGGEKNIDGEYELSAVTGLPETYSNSNNYDEYGINMSEMDEFFGDIVEFDPIEYTETTIENVYHRFNTAQRETTNPKYYNIYYDDLIRDDYEGEGDSLYGEFEVRETILNQVFDESVGESGTTYYYPGNIQLEGYFYSPHHKINLRRISDFKQQSYGYRLFVADIPESNNEKYEITVSDKSEEGTYTITYQCRDNYNFLVGDILGLCPVSSFTPMWGVLTGYTKYDDRIELNIETTSEIREEDLNSGLIDVLLTDAQVPSYAIYNRNNQIFIWRDITPISALNTDDPLFNKPYSNGCHYFESNINLFVRRQDPDGKYGLLAPETAGKELNGHPSPTGPFRRYGQIAVLSGLEYQSGFNLETCI